MIKQSFLFIFAIFSIALAAQEAEVFESQPPITTASDNEASPALHFISDDLFIYMHTGPGTNYRILGSVTAGTTVTLLDSDEESDFSQIIDTRGRTGWVKTEFLNEGESIRAQIPKLEAQINSTQQEDTQLSENLVQLEMELVASKDENKLLQEQIAQLQKETDDVNQQLSVQTSDSEKDWFLKGGIVSIGGAFFGVLITLLLRRKKRSDGFYDRY